MFGIQLVMWAIVIGLIICGLNGIDTETRPAWRALAYFNLLLAVALTIKILFF